MATRQRFTPLEHADPLRPPDRTQKGRRLTRALRDRVISRFEKISEAGNTAGAVFLPPLTGSAQPAPANEPEPQRGTPECARCWAEMVGDLSGEGRPKWKQCTEGPLCGIVPVVWNDWCVAGCKLVASPNAEGDFKRDLELLHILVENFVAHETELLSTCCTQEELRADSDREIDDGECAGEHPAHPQLLRAISHIKSHLSDTDLTVAGIAERLKMNATYLAHLFSTRMGQRMSRFIATQRIELAKKLLATTEWQIKRVAFECGYANPDWFSHVFHDYVGCPPGEYRRRHSVVRPN